MFFNYIALWFAINCVFENFIPTAKAVDCFSNNEINYRCHFGSVTPYRFIANINGSLLNYPGCKESKIWLLIRHGTRFPGKDDVVGMTELLPKFKDKIIENYRENESLIPAGLIDQLNKWSPALRVEDEKNLAIEGGKEMVGIAERFQSRFSTLFPATFSNATFKFKYTFTERTEQSARNFTFGLFGDSAAEDVWYYPSEEKDMILRPYKLCDRWQKEVKDNPDASKEVELFKKSRFVIETLKELSNLFGFEVNYDDANLMYTTCAFETSWSLNADSPWCKFLTFDNFKVLEYVGDLESFWQDGYGFEISYRQVCPTFGDMFQFFQSASDLKTTAYFSHSGMILKLLALLGVAKDEKPLTHDSYNHHRDNRLWRRSWIDSFAANIGFVLYECEKDGPGIIALHQERVINIPGCPNDSPCPLSTFEKLYSQTINKCDFTAMCSV